MLLVLLKSIGILSTFFCVRGTAAPTVRPRPYRPGAVIALIVNASCLRPSVDHADYALQRNGAAGVLRNGHRYRGGAVAHRLDDAVGVNADTAAAAGEHGRGVRAVDLERERLGAGAVNGHVGGAERNARCGAGGKRGDASSGKKDSTDD